MSEHVADLVEAYVHGLCDDTTNESVKLHCQTCKVCQEALEEAKRRLARLKAVPGDKASPPLIAAAMSKVDANIRLRRWKVRAAVTALGTLAAACLVLIGLNFYVQNMEATPYDLVVLGQRELLASTDASMRFRLMDRKANAPVAGMAITVELIAQGGQILQLGNFTTDAQGGGQARFHLPDSDGDYRLRATAQTPRGPEVLEEQIHVVRSWKVMLTSDKPVYQPGQTIHLRALALRRLGLQPAANEPVVFTIADPRNTVVFKDEGKTSRFGITATDCPLASEIIEGDYTITCNVGNTSSLLQVEVKKYVLPKFKVDVTFDRPFYRPGDTVKATVRADYFFGKPVANAELEVKMSGAGEKKWSVHTDDKGVATVTYDWLAPAVAGDEDKALEFEAKLTDAAGQTVTKTAQRRVTSNTVRLEVIPENGRLVAGVPNRIYVLTSTADGRPLPLTILVSIDFEEIRTTTNDRGAGVFELLPGQSQVATVRALTPRSSSARLALGCGFDAGPGLDGEGTVLVRKRVDLGSEALAADFLLRTDEAVYTAGDALTVEIISTNRSPVYVELVKEGQTILSETVVPTDGKGQCQFTLPQELAGTMELCAYRITSGQPVQKTRVLYVRPPEDVQITTTIDDKAYRPGQRAKLDFRLTDASGKPLQGALSLAAVDEAAFAVMRTRPGMERNFYSVNPELLQEVIKHGDWSPVRQGDAHSRDNAVREAALFAATTKVEGSENDGRNFSDSTESVRASRLHTLADASRAAKVEAVDATRHRIGQWISPAWHLLAVLTLGMAYSAVWLCFPVKQVAKAHLVFGTLLVLLMCIALGLDSNFPIASNNTFSYIGQRVGSAGRSDASVQRSAARALPAVEIADITEREAILQTKALTNLGGFGRGNRDWRTPDSDFAYPGLNGASLIRVREFFPETLLWEPQLITDEQGRTSIDLELADSITTWRLGASAVTADGRLGAVQRPLTVFQPFFVDLNLPVALTRGDEVAVPVVVYNYLDRPQTVRLTLDDADWFKRVDDAEKRIELAPGQLLATSYRLRVEKVGEQALTVTARGGDVTDAIRRKIEVVPNGRRFEEVFNGSLQEPVNVGLDLPPNAIEGSPRAIVKIYPSSFSQLVEGLDGIFQMPSGCFEQTSSTTYPNILALDYLRKTKQSQPEIEKRAEQYIHLGYQRLLSFEVRGGGFDWFGRAPANRTLTAYVLMEFEDMNRVHPIDVNVIARTRDWLLQQRNKDGSWTPEGHLPHDALQQSGEQWLASLQATAYIAWAVYSDPKITDADGRTRAYLLSFSPEEIKNPYTLALVCNALLNLDASAAGKYLDRLESMKKTENEGRFVSWTQPRNARTAFYGAGRGGDIEATALAVLALQRSGHAGTANAALAWLLAQKDARGTWYSTQATVLCLKALVGGMTSGGDNHDRRIEIRLDDKLVEQLVIPANRSEVMAQLDLSSRLKPGRQQLTLKETTGTGVGYQVTFRYHTDGAAPEKGDVFSVDLAYDRTEVAVGEIVKVNAKVVNRMSENAAMVMLSVPVPAGFSPNLQDFDQLQDSGVAAKYQVLSQSVLIYLRDLPAGKPLELTYHLRATMPATVTSSGARAYEYYAPERKGQSDAVKLTVK